MASKDRRSAPRAYKFELRLTANDKERAFLRRLTQFAVNRVSDPAARDTAPPKPHVRLASFQCNDSSPNLNFIGQFKTPVQARFERLAHSATPRSPLVIALQPSEELYALYCTIINCLQELDGPIRQDLQFPPLQLFPETDVTDRQSLQHALEEHGRVGPLQVGHQSFIRLWDPELDVALEAFNGTQIELWRLDGVMMSRKNKWQLRRRQSWFRHFPFLR